MYQETLRQKFDKLLDSVVPTNLFKWQARIYRIHGLLSPENKYLKILYIIWCFPHIIFITLYLVLVEIIRIIDIWSYDLKQFLLTVTVTLIHVLSSLRIILWHFYMKARFSFLEQNINRTMDFTVFNIDDVNLMEEVKYFTGKKADQYEDIKRKWGKVHYLFVKDTKYNQRNAIDEYESQQELYARFICIYVLMCYYISMILVFAFAYTRKMETYVAFNPRINRTSVYTKLPFDTYIPFDYSLSDGNVLWAKVYQLYMYIGNVGTFIVLDNTGANFIKLLQTKLKVLNFAIRQIDGNIKTDDKNSAMLIREIRLTKCMDEIQLVIKGAKIFEDLFNGVLLIQNILASLMLCTCLYTSQLVTTTGELFYVVLICLLVLFEPIFMSWYSTSLQEEFYRLLPVIYELQWLDYSLPLRRKIVYLMMVLGKPKRLTLGGLVNLDMSFYLSFVKNSYSAYTLISSTQKSRH